MKLRSLPFFFLAVQVTVISSCTKPKPDPQNYTRDDRHFYDLGGNEAATCMMPLGENNLLFIQSSTVSYHLLLVDPWGKEISRKEYPMSPSQFVAETMVDMDNGKFLLAGNLDGHPAYCLSDTSASLPLQFQSQSEEGRWYDATRNGNDFYLCGQLEVNGDWQVYMGKIEPGGQMTDTLTFGTSAADGGIDLMVSEGKTYLLAFSYGLGKGDRDIWVMETGSDLSPSNQKAYGGTGYDQPEQLLAAHGAIYLCGHTTSFGDPMHDVHMLCLEKDLSLRWEKNVARDGHEGADDMALLPNGNIAWCSYGELPVNLGYFGIMTPEGQTLYQYKSADYDRFFRVRAYKDNLLFLGSSEIGLGKDVSLRGISYP